LAGLKVVNLTAGIRDGRPGNDSVRVIRDAVDAKNRCGLARRIINDRYCYAVKQLAGCAVKQAAKGIDAGDVG